VRLGVSNHVLHSYNTDTHFHLRYHQDRIFELKNPIFPLITIINTWRVWNMDHLRISRRIGNPLHFWVLNDIWRRLSFSWDISTFSRAKTHSISN
jgi:hypothetical protein